MKKGLLAGTIAILFLLSASTISVVKASPGTIELIGKEWNHDPLKVYIKAPSDLVPHVLTALNDWSSALEYASENTVDDSEISGDTDGIFDFTIVSSRKEADIIITVERGAAAGVLGMTLVYDNNGDGYIDKVKIMVKAGRGLDLADFRNVVRHEIGHALGLGHADDPNDLMYPTYDASAISEDIYPSSTLDINALLYIYYSDGFGSSNLSPEDIPPTYP
ncbi:MAG: matrixin family metalloprotease [Nitrososphaerota archaeon]